MAASQSFANNIIEGNLGSKIQGEVVSKFNYPWSMSFIGNDHLLVATKPGKLWLVDSFGSKTEVKNILNIQYGGQGGMGDVVPHPNYKKNKYIYLSYITSDDGGMTRYAVVDRANLRDLSSPKLENRQRIWEQFPAVKGKGHFSHRIVFGPEGSVHENKIFITSGDRQMQKPAQMWDTNFGKIVRLNDDGSVPQQNPFQSKGELAKTFWTTGHRNPLGIAFDQKNNLSRITIVTTGTPEVIEQIVLQLKKLVPVHKVANFKREDKNVIFKEMALLKILGNNAKIKKVLNTCKKYNPVILDQSTKSAVIQITALRREIDNMTKKLKSLGLISVSRTGAVAMTRGAEIFN
mgnify:CR=1 FL=1